MLRSTSSMLLVALTSFVGFSPSSTEASTLLFDFGRTDLQSNPGWNNLVPATGTLFATFDSSNALTPIGIEITDPFYQAGEPSPLGSGAPAGDAASYPVSATDDFFFGHAAAWGSQAPNPLGQFKLFNLDPSMTYDFTFFASRQVVSDNRETSYVVNGANSDSGVLDAANNNTEVLRINGILPDANNEIFVDVTPGPNNSTSTGFYYINLMQVDVVPEPASVALMGAAGLMVLGRRGKFGR